MKPLFLRALFLALLVASPLSAADQEIPKLTVSTDRTEAHVGEPIRYEVWVRRPDAITVTLQVSGARLGPFSIDRSGLGDRTQQDGWVTEAYWFDLTCFETGTQIVPAPIATYTQTDATVHELIGEPVTITVISLLADDWQSQDIKDIKGPVRPASGPVWGWIAYFLAGVILFIAWFVFRRRSRGKRHQPALAPHVVAREALLALRQRTWLTDGLFEIFYVQLSAIVRQYVESRFGLRAPEMTTEEFLQVAIKAGMLSGAQRQLLQDFLSQCDLVKFARYQPQRAQAEAALEAALRFVEETAPSSDAQVQTSGAQT